MYRNVKEGRTKQHERLVMYMQYKTTLQITVSEIIMDIKIYQIYYIRSFRHGQKTVNFIKT